jgi:hypothetical protein
MEEVNLTPWERIEWNLDLAFLKGVEKTKDECAKTINPENHFF